MIVGSGGNNTLVGGNYMYDYDSIGLSAELGVMDVLIPGKNFSIFADYIKNDDSDEDTGRAFGFKFGDKKVGDQHTWQLKFVNADLEADAFVDFLPDSDRLGGNTGVKSNEVVFKYAVANSELKLKSGQWQHCPFFMFEFISGL